jgi:hypothetical protein
LLLLATQFLFVKAQSISSSKYQDSINVFADFFDGEKPLEITLEFDLKTLQRDRLKEEYVYAKLSYIENQDTLFAYPVRIKTRGVFRKSFCNIPPFWLNINNSGIQSEDLGKTKKMKVVTHCMKLKNYQDYVLKEYLAYKIYNIISPYSFRVRLLRIKYIDTGRKNKVSEGWAFAIEPIELLASRLDAKHVENEELAMVRMNASIMNKLAMYYYMTGNTDFSVTGLHNIKVLLLNNPGPLGYIPVPYDFDFTGFVNSSYASPAENVNIEKVTDRYFLGICRTDLTYKRILDEFKAMNELIYPMLQSFEYLSNDEKLEMLEYIEDFYDEIEREDFISGSIRSTCK